MWNYPTSILRKMSIVHRYAKYVFTIPDGRVKCANLSLLQVFIYICFWIYRNRPIQKK